jgi:hypothetical protein
MDRPTSIAAVVVGLAAGFIATAAPPPVVADAATVAPANRSAPASTASAPACVRRAPERNIAPQAVSPVRPPDMQVDSDGLNRSGGVGSLPSDVRGDPCEAVVRPGERGRAIERAASAAMP